MLGGLVIQDRYIPFVNFISDEGYLSHGYFRDMFDELEEKIIRPDNTNLIEDFIKDIYNDREKDLPTLEDIIFSIEEFNMCQIVDMSMIEQIGRCCLCEDCHKCWIQGSHGLTYDDFENRNGLTDYGDFYLDSCYCDSETTIAEINDYGYSAYGHSFKDVILGIIKTNGYAMHITETDYEEYFWEDYQSSQCVLKDSLFNDCQVILFPEMDRNMVVNKTECLMLTG